MRRLALFAAAAAALAITGCATRIVSAHVDRGVDFAAYRTYDWGRPDAFPTGDPRLDNNAIFHDYFQGAIEKALALRHLTMVSAEPDLLVHYHTNVTRQLDVQRVEREYEHCYGRGCEPTIVEYELGTLMIDVVDARSNRLVWRAWSRDSVSGVIDHQDRLRQAVVDAVAEMMKAFPKPL